MHSKKPGNIHSRFLTERKKGDWENVRKKTFFWESTFVCNFGRFSIFKKRWGRKRKEKGRVWIGPHELHRQRRRNMPVQGRQNKDSQRGEFWGEAMGVRLERVPVWRHCSPAWGACIYPTGNRELNLEASPTLLWKRERERMWLGLDHSQFLELWAGDLAGETTVNAECPHGE